MQEPQFIHLRTHSDFSFLRGALKVSTILDLAESDGQVAVGLSDINNLFGAYEFSQKAYERGIQPILAMELDMVDYQDLTSTIEQLGLRDIPEDMSQHNRRSRLVLIVQNEVGYDNLRRLVSHAYNCNAGYNGLAFGWGDLVDYSDGLIVLSGGTRGALDQLLYHSQEEHAYDLARHIHALFGDRFYIEINRHQLSEQLEVEPALLKLSESLGIGIVATNDCYFSRPDMYEAQDILACIGEGYTISDEHRPRLTQEHYFKSQHQMCELFSDLPDALENSVAIARRCGYGLRKAEPSLPGYRKLEGRSEDEALADLAHAGLEKRLRSMINGDIGHDEYRKRLDYELGVICEVGFSGYFLIVADFIQWAKEQHIPVGPGRGSGAGSLVSWSLTITDLDPLHYGLLFERFLNPERVSMPDFDIDFCQDKRELVIDYVQGEYGEHNVAQIATFGKLQARAVLRDVGRVLKLRYGDVDRVCKMVPNDPADVKTLQEALDSEPLLRTEYNSDSSIKRLIDMAKKLEGLYRHVGTHAAGIVIGDKPLSDILPLYKDSRSAMMVTQFNMKDVENVGLVKFDFLGLKTLTVIDRCLRLIKEHRGEDLDLSSIDLGDSKVFDFLCHSSAVGIFQLESSGMQDVMRKMRPDRLEDLIAIVALYRPGPMANIPSYIRRKHGEESVEYIHEALESVLSETFGIPIYQEQVMRMAQVLAGYSLGRADLLRRAMGKKEKAEMDAQRVDFVAGAALKHGIDKRKADKIYDEMEAFASYGFNKTHAAAYAVLAYQTAYLKTHYGCEFMASLLSLDSANTERLEVLIEECRRLGIEVRPVDINASGSLFSIEVDGGVMSIRYGLAALKGVGELAVDRVLSERDSGGDFVNVYDFFERCAGGILNKKLLEGLVRAGAFDCLNPNRNQMFRGLDMLRDYGQSFQQRIHSDQNFLFGASVETQNRPVLPKVEDLGLLQRSQGELESVGFYLSSHPLDAYESRLGELGVISSEEILSVDFDKSVAYIAGVITSIRVIRTKRGVNKGKKIAFISVGDKSGYCELTAYEEDLDRYGDLLSVQRLIFAEVTVRRDEGRSVRLLIGSVYDLAERLGGLAESLVIGVEDLAVISDLRRVFGEHAQSGRGSVSVVVRGREVLGCVCDIRLDLGISLNLTDDLCRAVKSLSGVVLL